MSVELAFALTAMLAFLAGHALSKYRHGAIIREWRRDLEFSRANESRAFKAGELVGYKEGIREGVYLEREAWLADGDGGPEGDGEPMPVPLDEQDGNVRAIRRVGT